MITLPRLNMPLKHYRLYFTFLKNNSNHLPNIPKKMFSKYWNFGRQHKVFIQCGGRVCKQTVGIQMAKNRAPLLADSYEADFIAGLIQRKEYCLARFSYLSVRYVDDVLLLNNPSFEDFIHRIYPKERDNLYYCIPVS